MCGILGILTRSGERPSGDRRLWERMRDRLAHRGPDAAGLYERENVVLAHRRLKVIDTTEGGAQPMRLGAESAPHAIVYNGELYNEQELRVELAKAGHHFRSTSDTETLLAALAAWGVEALHRLRGMYAFGYLDAARQRVVLARDPLGIKPLCWWQGEIGGVDHIIFASEPAAILEHPAVPRRPDMAAVAGYLVTIRTTLGERTMHEGVRTLTPGQALVIDLHEGKIDEREWWEERRLRGWVRGFSPMDSLGTLDSLVRAGVEDSLRRHLRSDVPISCLLSGGLDSTIAASLAKGELGTLHTYCSGEPGGEDFGFARRAAQRLGTTHHEAPVTRGLFGERWREMVRRMEVPLSTPNEVAINEVARTLRTDGNIVAISGEGADELFGGYDLALKAIDAARRGAAGGAAGWLSYLATNSWIKLTQLSGVLSDAALRDSGGGLAVVEYYRSEFKEVELLRRELGHRDALQVYQMLLRRVNLEGLLRRLDTAMMLEGVEGRTPLADAALCELAEAMPMEQKVVIGENGTPSRTKIALRRVFEPDVPAEILTRPKASFPLPFQDWMTDTAECLDGSQFLREVFTRDAIDLARTDPKANWHLAWPMINLALWGERF